MKIIYNGYPNPMRIRVGNSIIVGWKKGEIKDLDKKIVEILLKNKDFSLVTKVIKEDKKEEEKILNVKNKNN